MAKKTKDSNLSLEERLEQALIPNWDEPYKLPENWCWTKLESIAKWGSGGTPSRKNPEYYIGNIPWIKTGELDNGYIYDTEEHISEKALANSSAKLFPVNTVVIAMYGATIGKVGIMAIEATTNQACACAVCSPSIDYKYLFYYAISQRDAFIGKGKGGAQPNISQDIIKQHEIPLPPLAEQRRIVVRVESLFAKLEEAKEKAQEIVDGFETRKAAILQKAFSGELTAKWRENNGISIETWKEYDLQSVCSEKITDGTHKTPIYSDAINGIPFLSSKDVTSEKIDWENIKYIDVKLHEELYTRLAPQIDDVLLAKNGTTGVAALVDVEKVFDLYVTLAVLRPNKAIISPKFLHKIVNSPICKTQFNNHLKGIGVPNLHLRDIKKVVINVPTLPEQEEIVRILEKLIVNEQKSKETAEAVIERIETMKKAILARAFRGELGTNDPSEESAVELLKQVLSTATEPNKSVAKRTIIPNSLESRIKTDLERKIVKLYIQNEVDILSIDLIMGVSSKKFEIMEALRNLQQRCLLEKQNDKYKLLG